MDNNNPKIVSLKGLSAREAKRLLRIHGENIIYRKNRIRPILTFIKKLNSPLFLTLSGVAVLSLFLGEKTNSVIILVMISLSATLDFWNSYWSEKAVGRLTVKVSSTATVLRDGVRREVPFKFVMPGDLIFLSAGDIVPADATILEANNLFVNESALTGESFPAGKTEKPPQNAVRMGTSVVAGLASARVTSIGFNTEFGKIAEHMATNPPETDFEKGIREFSFFIMKVTFVLVVFVFLVNAIFGRDILTSLLFAIAIAIGLTPELLPIIMSVGFSRGSIRMAKRDVIVKNLSSIQSFGSMNVLCTDKTGTLTEDHIVLVRYTDGFGRDYEPVLRFAYLSTKFHSAVRSPLDDAIAEHKPPDEISGYRKIYEVPFDFERKRNSVAVKNKEGAVLITKGAPEEMIKVSSYYEDGEGFRTCTNAIKDKIMEQFRFFSADGFRVLGVAIKNVDGDKTEFTSADEFGMTFCGFIIFIDPPKPTAKDALLALNALGVNVKILTGDSEILTQKICRDIGLPVKKVITGSELEKMSAEKLLLNVRETTVFARINPIQKERVIIALKKTGHSVGYLGDGINDAPALKAADIGISVNNAVDIAKETADIVLLRKSLGVLRNGIMEGRTTYHNTMKYITMGLSSNFGNMFSMTTASIFLPFLPMLPVQILLNNFLYDASQLMLAGDRVDAADVAKPHQWNLKAIKRFMVVFGSASSIFDFITFWVLYAIFNLNGDGFQTGWFMESLATQVLVIFAIRTKKLAIIKSRPSTGVAINAILAVIAGWLITFTPIGEYFGFIKTPINILLGISAIVLVYLAVVEWIKIKFYRRYSVEY